MKSKRKMTTVFVWSLAPIALVLMLLPQLVGAQGATFTVNSTADTVDINPGDGICADGSGNCTLRAAIMEANAFPGADSIDFDSSVFNVPQTITLSIPGVNEEFDATGDLDITSDLTITGAGANKTTIDGGGIDRVFDIRPINTTNVRISGLTVTGGKTLSSSPGGGAGGGILSQGTLLTLTNVTVDDNEADNGGGIFVGGPVTLNNCTVSNNTALTGGFGGGGILNYINGPLTLNNSTVSGNNTGHFAGGIVTTTHGPTLILNDSTVSFNGGGLYNAAGTVIIKNTILADNGSSGNCTFQGGTLTSLGYNLSTDVWCEPAHLVSGGLGQPTDLNNRPALLAPLALNPPGSTKTHALLPGSPAIDAGGDCLPTDQRGVPRPQGAACDIGAYEVGGACVPPPPNMVAWWPGDGNANDIVGGNNGTLVGATIDPAGMVDQAFGFDGVNDFVAVPNSASLNPGGSFSIDAWVYPRSNGFQTIAGKWGDTGDQPNQRSYVLVNTETGALNFGISDAAHQLDSAFHTLRTPDGALTLNAWNHVAVVYDQSTGTRKILVNGSQQATRTDPPITVLNSVARFGIGADLTSSTTSTALFNGLIDEVEFFNRALCASEIQAIYNAGSAGKCKCVPTPSGMVSTWPGDGNANDIVGGNNGTLVGATIDPAGIVHQAFSFDGVDDFVAVPNSASLNPGGSFSVDAWVYPRSNGIQTIVNKWGDTGDQPNQRSYGLINTGTGALNFGISDAAHQLDAAFHTLHTPDGALTLNAWNYVAAVYDQTTGTRKIFVNGGQQATRTDPPITVLNSVARFGIGAHLSSSTTSGAHFDGLIDEVSIYNRALTDAEIQSIFNAGSAGKCSPQPCAPTIICPENIVVDNSNHPGQCSAVVNYTVSASASCSSVTVGCSPPSSSVFPKGTTTVNCAATNSDGTAACSFTVTVIPPQLSTLSPARVWIGLKTSDDVGTKFDLLAEILKNGAVVGTGQLNGVPGGSSGFNNAVLNTITLALSSLPVDICPGDALGFRVSVRVATNSGHSSGTARLWYNGKFIDTGANRDAGSRFDATIGGGTADYFLRTAVLNTTAGSSKTFIDVPVNRNVGGNPFKPFGTWSITF